MLILINLLSRVKNKLIRLLYLRNPVNIIAGHKIYKNDSGFIANFIGNIVLKKVQKSSISNKLNFSDLTINAVNTLKSEGFIQLEDKVSQTVIDEINKHFYDEIKNLPIPSDGRIELSSIDNVSFYKKFPIVQNILFTKSIKKILETYYNAGFKVINTHIYRTIPVEKIKNTSINIEAYGSTEFWHNDGSTTDSLKLFVLLNDVNEQNGPMHIINKKDTKKIVAKGFTKYREGLSNGIIENDYKVNKFMGRCGSIMLADTNLCLHRGDIVKKNNHRDMLVFYLIPSQNEFSGIEAGSSSREQFFGFKRLLFN